MSPSIWTACAGSSRQKPLALQPFRVVESQYVTATRKLVDSDDEQALLEELIDTAKPPRPIGRQFDGLHYLLYTSFRHPPLRNGSRFGTRYERGIWYGSLELRTAFAEVAYYRLVFLEGSAAELGAVTVELSAFRAHVKTERGVDLTVPPFAEHAARISSRTHYRTAQRLGRDMRDAGVEVCVFSSARDAERGKNVALFEPAFAKKRPTVPESWVCTAARDKVEMAKKDVFKQVRMSFPRSQFELRGTLPAPAVT